MMDESKFNGIYDDDGEIIKITTATDYGDAIKSYSEEIKLPIPSKIITTLKSENIPISLSKLFLEQYLTTTKSEKSAIDSIIMQFTKETKTFCKNIMLFTKMKIKLIVPNTTYDLTMVLLPEPKIIVIKLNKEN